MSNMWIVPGQVSYRSSSFLKNSTWHAWLFLNLRHKSWVLVGAIVFQLCLIFSAWLKFAPQQSDSKLGPVNHYEAAVAMTVILAGGIVYILIVTLSWAQESPEPVFKVMHALNTTWIAFDMPWTNFTWWWLCDSLNSSKDYLQICIDVKSDPGI